MCVSNVFRFNIPSNVRDLRAYITGLYYSEADSKENDFVPNSKAPKATCNSYFLPEALSSGVVPMELSRFAQQVCIALGQCWNKEEVLNSACIEIEACRDYRDNRKRGFVVAPHLAAPGELEHYVYRVRHIHSMKTLKKAAIGRRKVVVNMDGLSTVSVCVFTMEII